MVHHACSVYRALPSDSRATTRRSGAATAAPTATGSPWPMAPPVRHSQSWGGEPAVAPGANRPDVFPSSETMAPSGSSAPRAWQTRRRSEWAGRRFRGADPGPGRRSHRGPHPFRQGRQGGAHVVGRSGHGVHGAPRGHQIARLARVGEERDGGGRVEQHQVADPLELEGHELGEVGQPLHRGRPAPRSRRDGKVSANSTAPQEAAMSAAWSSAGPRQARPPMRTTAGCPDRSAPAAAASRRFVGGAPDPRR